MRSWVSPSLLDSESYENHRHPVSTAQRFPRRQSWLPSCPALPESFSSRRACRVTACCNHGWLGQRLAFTVRCVHTCVACSRCLVQCFEMRWCRCAVKLSPGGHRNHHTYTLRRSKFLKQYNQGQHGFARVTWRIQPHSNPCSRSL